MQTTGGTTSDVTTRRGAQVALVSVIRTVNFLAIGILAALLTGTAALGILSRSSDEGNVSLFGRELLIVRSGSMAPEFDAGDAVLIKHVDERTVTTLRDGDIITVRPSPASNLLVTHRIVRIVDAPGAGRMFTTKGDANPTADSTVVTGDRVIGVVQHAIPRLGYAMYAMQQTRTLLVFVAALVLGRLAIALVHFAEGQETTNNTIGDTQ